MVDYAYGQQQELLRQVKQGLIEVATARRRLDRQSQKLSGRVPVLEDRARRALEAGREDLARLAVQRKQAVSAELEGLEAQLAEMAEEESKLTMAEQQLAARVEDFGLATMPCLLGTPLPRPRSRLARRSPESPANSPN